MKFSLIIPCYNEEKNISYLIKKLKKFIINKSYEVILVDNGSSDNTYNNLVFEYDFYKAIDQKYIENNYFFYLILSEIANNAEINVITVKLKIGDKYHDSLEEFYYSKFIKNV